MLSIAAQNMDTAYLGSEFSKGMIDTLKKSMTLDFPNRPTGNLLDSPDLKMAQWTTPDLENMIFQQGGLLMHTPAPGNLMRLVSLREDEKPDLRGFDEALAKLHAQRNAESLQQFAESEYSPAPPRDTDSQSQSQAMQQIELVYSRAPSKRPFNETIIGDGLTAAAKQARLGSAKSNEDDSSCSSSSWSEEDDESYSQRNVPRGALSLNGSPRTATANAGRSAVQYAGKGTTNAAGHYSGSQKHTSSRHGHGAASSAVQPVDYNTQDRMRVERKRERNRLAARKCRERKIKKIDELTGQVQKLEGDKKNLATRISRMQAEISRLQSLIQDHAHSGCKIPLGSR